MSSEQIATQFLSNNPTAITGSPCGISCNFIDMGNGWGIKIYAYIKEGEESVFYPDERDDHYRAQTEAAKYGLGPNVGASFDLPDGTPCYITEVVEPIVPHNEVHTWQVWERHWVDLKKELKEEIEKLCKDLEKHIDFYFHDCHLGNLGRKNGKLVCIDFGE